MLAEVTFNTVNKQSGSPTHLLAHATNWAVDTGALSDPYGSIIMVFVWHLYSLLEETWTRGVNLRNMNTEDEIETSLMTTPNIPPACFSFK